MTSETSSKLTSSVFNLELIDENSVGFLANTSVLSGEPIHPEAVSYTEGYDLSNRHFQVLSAYALGANKAESVGELIGCSAKIVTNQTARIRKSTGHYKTEQIIIDSFREGAFDRDLSVCETRELSMESKSKEIESLTRTEIEILQAYANLIPVSKSVGIQLGKSARYVGNIKQSIFYKLYPERYPENYPTPETRTTYLEAVLMVGRAGIISFGDGYLRGRIEPLKKPVIS